MLPTFEQTRPAARGADATMSKPLTDDEILLLSKLQSRIDRETWRRLYECRPGDPDWPLAAPPESRDTPPRQTLTAEEEDIIRRLERRVSEGVDYAPYYTQKLIAAVRRLAADAASGAAGATTTQRMRNAVQAVIDAADTTGEMGAPFVVPATLINALAATLTETTK